MDHTHALKLEEQCASILKRGSKSIETIHRRVS